MRPTPLPYLTDDIAPLGGAIKQRPEDFRVSELPLYPACGEGDHLFFRVEKRGLPTRGAIEIIARHMGVPAGQIGSAGLKDAQAVTDQWMSLEHADQARLGSLDEPNVRILEITRHNNKIRTGHLAGNRFAVRIRGIGARELPAAREILEILSRRGVPNWYTEQRFGERGMNPALGGCIVRSEWDRFIELYLGGPDPDEPEPTRRARELYDQGELQRALRAWPRQYRDRRRVLQRLCQSGGDARRGFGAVDKFTKRFLVSAFQSELFNRVLIRRLDSLDRVFAGDWAVKTDSGGVFQVEDEAIEQPRAEAWEISPTGPIFGYRSRLADREPGQIEQAVLQEQQLQPEHFRKKGGHKMRGTRRALRYRPEGAEIDAGRDQHGPFVEVRFAAGPGCYATSLLREIVKSG